MNDSVYLNLASLLLSMSVGITVLLYLTIFPPFFKSNRVSFGYLRTLQEFTMLFFLRTKPQILWLVSYIKIVWGLHIYRSCYSTHPSALFQRPWFILLVSKYDIFLICAPHIWLHMCLPISVVIFHLCHFQAKSDR